MFVIKYLHNFVVANRIGWKCFVSLILLEVKYQHNMVYMT